MHVLHNSFFIISFYVWNEKNLKTDQNKYNYKLKFLCKFNAKFLGYLTTKINKTNRKLRKLSLCCVASGYGYAIVLSEQHTTRHLNISRFDLQSYYVSQRLPNVERNSIQLIRYHSESTQMLALLNECQLIGFNSKSNVVLISLMVKNSITIFTHNFDPNSPKN